MPADLKQLATVRQLRALVMVFQTGSVSAAAQGLALSQPSVSLLLRDLEATLGVPLFFRTPQGLRATPAARQAVRYAEQALAQLTALHAAMQGQRQGARPALRVAATASLAQHLLPRAMARLAKTAPHIDVHIEDCAPGEFIDLILGGRVDCGVGALPEAVPGLEERLLFRDPVVAAGLASQLPGRGALRGERLLAHRLIAVRPGYGIRAGIEQAFRARGLQFKAHYEVGLLSTALGMAAQGLGVAVVPASVVAPSGLKGLVVRGLIAPSVSRNVSIFTRSSLPPSADFEAFAQALQQSVPRPAAH